MKMSTYNDIKLIIDNEPWFVGKDVCEAFGDSHYLRSLSRLEAYEKGMTQNDTLVEQRIEKLRLFKRCIVHEVIPAIRKHGVYATPETATIYKLTSKAILPERPAVKFHFIAVKQSYLFIAPNTPLLLCLNLS